MFFMCPTQESHSEFSDTDQVDKDPCKDPTNNSMRITSMGLRYKRLIMVIIYHVMYINTVAGIRRSCVKTP
jgi:hypothetical protein